MKKSQTKCEQVVHEHVRHKQVVNKSLTTHEQVTNKVLRSCAWTSYELGKNKWLTTHEQLMNKSQTKCEQVVNK